MTIGTNDNTSQKNGKRMCTTKTEQCSINSDKECKKGNMKIVSYNCKGYKQSCDYVLNTLLKPNSIVCVTETWLRQSELGVIKESITRNPNTRNLEYTIFAKSSMNDTETVKRGRPYGGMKIITNITDGLLRIFKSQVTE